MNCRAELLTLRLPADPAQTERLGVLLGQHLTAGAVLALTGELGAGKTTLVRGLARGLGVDEPEAVVSPTYLLVIEHQGPVPLRHADAYLPAKLAGFLDDGGLEYLLDPQAVTAIEWADRITAMVPAAALWLDLAVLPAGGRQARFTCAAGGGFPWLPGVAKILAPD